MDKEIKIISWNVNGIRAAERKGFLDWMSNVKPDILCLQETKAHSEQLNAKLLNPDGYLSFWHSPSVKKGYSGVVIYCKERPLDVQTGFGIDKFDEEGRVVLAEFKEFTLFNVYFPNGKKNSERLNYKLEFYEAFLKYIDKLKKNGKKIVFCGDLNTAHKEIDLARPKQNEDVSGFLPIERRWVDRVIEHGYLDSLREFHAEQELYTWWDLKSRARERNVGWRLDYIFIDKSLCRNLKGAFIMPEVTGSDHCPTGAVFKF